MTANRSGSNRYTLSGDAAVEGHIGKIVSQVVDDIVSLLDPIAVFLYGSLGRGEGTAYLDGGVVKMVSDYEIAYVSRDPFDKSKLKKLAGKLAQKYDIDLTLNFILPRRLTSGAPLNWAPTESTPSIEQYELKEFSRLLYGEDLRETAPKLSAGDIVLWEAVRLLYNRMAEFTDALYQGGGLDNKALLKASNKLLIASGDALLLSAGRYHGHYLERMKRVGMLLGAGGDLADLLSESKREVIIRAYALKLYPEKSESPEIKEWITKSIAISEEVFRYVIALDMDIEFLTYDEFSKSYLSHPKLKEYCRTNSRLQNFVSLVRTRASSGGVRFLDFLGPVAAQHKVYVLLPKWLYGRFKPLWNSSGFGSLDDEVVRSEAKEVVEKWRRLCE